MMTLSIRDDYYDKFNALLDALPKDAVCRVQTKSFKDEIEARVQGYQNGTLKTVPLEEGFNEMRAKIVSKCK